MAHSLKTFKAHWMIMLFLASMTSTPLGAKVIPYTLHIAGKTVSFSGTPAKALAINGSIPGPVLSGTVGDTLRIQVINHLSVPSSLHWHGVLVPNAMDGVPFVNQLPIAPGQTFIYEFPITHSGTYWYHAHAGLQEQQGLYGAIVLHPKEEENKSPDEHVLVFSDWTDEDPEDVLAHVKKDPDYYALKKDTVQSWKKLIERGADAVQLRFKNAFMRMPPMDLSDIGYDAFLTNGKRTEGVTPASGAKRVKLRLINAAASTYFMVEYAGGPMTVVAADGVDVRPFTAQRVRMSMAETFDVLIPVQPGKAFELRASALDGTGHSSTFIGKGTRIPAPDYEKPDVLMMDMDHAAMGGHDMSQMDHMGSMGSMAGMAGMDHMGSMGHTKPTSHTGAAQIETLNTYAPLRALAPTVPSIKKTVRPITLKLTGSMERYVWTINDTPMYASDKIEIQKGEIVRFTLVNETMMDHPIHIHGHFFRVMNGQGDYSPLKHTVNVSPYETVVIEMEAKEDKDWIFHCHNLYHMKLGMGGVLHYAGSALDPALAGHEGGHGSEHGDLWFQATQVDAASNFFGLEASLMHGENRFFLDARKSYTRDYDIEGRFTRYVSDFLGVYVGGRFRREDDTQEHSPILGVSYTLPFFISSHLDINATGKVRLALANTHQLSDHLSFDWRWNTDRDYTLGLQYELNKTWAITGNYDAQERFGIGLRASF